MSMLVVMIVVLLVLLSLSIPIAVSIALSTMVAFAMYFPDKGMVGMLAQALVTALDSFPLLAIPFFMLVGTIMVRGGIAESLVTLAKMAVGKRTGGLGLTAIVASCFFAAISGSGPATVAAIGGIMIPYMVEQNYDPAYSAGLVAGASTIGPVIPPSIPMIMFGVTAGISVSTLFAAGILPGLLMGGVLGVYNYFVCKKEGYTNVPPPMTKEEKKQAWKKGIWALLMPIIILGCIYTGVATPTESAIIGVVYAFIVSAFIYRTLTWKKLKDALVEAGISAATVMFLFGGATTFGRVLSLGQIPTKIAQAVLSMEISPLVVLLIVNVILLIAGMFIDAISSIIIFTPLFYPVLTAAGYNGFFIGVVFAINVSIGLVTPPLGPDLYIAQKVANRDLQDVLPKAIPVLGVLIALLLVLILVPNISLILPKLFGMI